MTKTTSTSKASTKATSTSGIDWTFGPDTVTVGGIAFPATYSPAKGGDVYVFAVAPIADGKTMPVRIHVTPNMPLYAAALEAAKGTETKPAEAPKADPAPVTVTKPAKASRSAQYAEAAKAAKADPKPDTKPAPKATKPAEAPKADPKPEAPKAPKAPEAPKADPKPEAPKAPKAPKADPKPAPKAPEAPKTPKADPKPDTKPAAVTPQKPFAGSKLEGRGWSIVFDEALQRTRVILAPDAPEAVRAAVEAAGFWWSPTMQSYNKKLSNKAYRAAQELAAELAKLA